MDHSPIQQILKENRSFRFFEYISRGFDIFSRNLGSFVGFSILSCLMMGIVGSVPYVGKWASKFLMVPVLTAGFYLVAHAVNKGENTQFGDHFLGFQHLVRLGLAAMAISVVTTIASAPFFLANYHLFEWTWNLQGLEWGFEIDVLVDTFPGFQKWKLLLLVPMIYFAVAYSWTSKFIVFHDLNVWDAMEASRQLISKNWLIYLLFGLTIILIGMGGIVGFFIGIFFTYPAMLCIDYAAFEDMTQLIKAETETEYVDVLVK